ncbi:hypothetical protein BZG36_01044 [Bifiguratus adelaidae]|uniref:Cyclin N-terminal domain-containing protein n=1 Tax=Bifiguratus adelaidae TaxID=1938954 RepID=A0A261Y6D8_9FUNG|nr:hypothetical protein BZG36_01044 [Bifiguratus adelaidae]
MRRFKSSYGLHTQAQDKSVPVHEKHPMPANVDITDSIEKLTVSAIPPKPMTAHVKASNPSKISLRKSTTTPNFNKVADSHAAYEGTWPTPMSKTILQKDVHDTRQTTVKSFLYHYIFGKRVAIHGKDTKTPITSITTAATTIHHNESISVPVIPSVSETISGKGKPAHLKHKPITSSKTYANFLLFRSHPKDAYSASDPNSLQKPLSKSSSSSQLSLGHHSNHSKSSPWKDGSGSKEFKAGKEDRLDLSKFPGQQGSIRKQSGGSKRNSVDQSPETTAQPTKPSHLPQRMLKPSITQPNLRAIAREQPPAMPKVHASPHQNQPPPSGKGTKSIYGSAHTTKSPLKSSKQPLTLKSSSASLPPPIPSFSHATSISPRRNVNTPNGSITRLKASTQLDLSVIPPENHVPFVHIGPMDTRQLTIVSPNADDETEIHRLSVAKSSSTIAKSNSTSSLLTVDATLSKGNVNRTGRCVTDVLYGLICEAHEKKTFASDDVLMHKDPNSVRNYDKAQTQWHEINDQLMYVFECGELKAECAVITLVYIERMLKQTGFALFDANWRLALLGALLLAVKVWDDCAVYNIDFVVLFPEIGVKYMNKLERWYIASLDYDVSVKSSVFAACYFRLREIGSKAKEQDPNIKRATTRSQKLLEDLDSSDEESFQILLEKTRKADEVQKKTAKAFTIRESWTMKPLSIRDADRLDARSSSYMYAQANSSAATLGSVSLNPEGNACQGCITSTPQTVLIERIDTNALHKSKSVDFYEIGSRTPVVLM